MFRQAMVMCGGCYRLMPAGSDCICGYPDSPNSKTVTSLLRWSCTERDWGWAVTCETAVEINGHNFKCTYRIDRHGYDRTHLAQVFWHKIRTAKEDMLRMARFAAHDTTTSNGVGRVL